jgi:hypothetical protein
VSRPLGAADAALLRALPEQRQLVTRQQRRAIGHVHRKARKASGELGDELVIEPDFRTGRMGEKANQLSSYVTRRQNHLCYHAHRVALESHCLHANIPRATVSEKFTTGNCDNVECGRWNSHIGRSKVFTCVHCGRRACRDGKAAVAILKKSFHLLDTYYTRSDLAAAFQTARSQPVPVTNTATYAAWGARTGREGGVASRVGGCAHVSARGGWWRRGAPQ